MSQFHRCCGLQAIEANKTAECSACTNKGACFHAPTTPAAWTDASSPLFAATFPDQLVGNGSDFSVIEWNRDTETGNTLSPSQIMAGGESDGMDFSDNRRLTFQLKWLPADVSTEEADAFQVGKSPPGNFTFDAKQGPGGVIIDSSSGDIYAAPRTPGNYTAWLIAVDAAGPANQAGVPLELDQVLLKKWDLVVTPLELFAVESFERSNDVTGNLEVIDVGSAVPFTVKNCSFNEECSISRVIENSFKPAPSGRITYTVEVDRQKGGCAFSLLIDPDTGYMLGKYAAKNVTRDQRTTCTATLSAVQKDGNLPLQTAVLERFEITFRPDDVALDANGPNGQGCANGDQVDDGGSTFDQSFRCDCTGTIYEGDNCEIEKAKEVVTVDNTKDSGGLVGGLIGGFIAVLAVVGAAYKYRVHQISQRAFDFQNELASMMATGELDAMVGGGGSDGGPRLPREIKRANVTPTQVVGSGQFGEVWKAVLDERSAGGVPGYMVAVKTALDGNGSGADDLRREALVMAQVTDHCNVVALIGVVTSGVPLLLLISLCENGSLQSCLTEGRCPGQAKPGAAPFESASRTMALEIARGMKHLVDAHFVHRDLASRNVLVDSQFVCKIADFGLSRSVAASNPDAESASEYYTSHHGTFPVRWTAPEAMENLKFSTTTDVWSYGVVLLEIVMGGARPYADLQTNEQVIAQIVAGYRAPQPTDGCSDEFYSIMLQCWAEVPGDRPSFEQLAVAFEQQLATAHQHDGGSVASESAVSSLGQNEYNLVSTKETLQPDSSGYVTRSLGRNEYAATLQVHSEVNTGLPEEWADVFGRSRAPLPEAAAVATATPARVTRGQVLTFEEPLGDAATSMMLPILI